MHIRLQFDKEPGEAYGESRDSYMIETVASDGIKSCVYFSTFDEIEEFARHLEEYVQRERGSE